MRERGVKREGEGGWESYNVPVQVYRPTVYVCTTSIGGGDTRGHGAAEVQGGGEEISEAVQHAS